MRILFPSYIVLMLAFTGYLQKEKEELMYQEYCELGINEGALLLGARGKFNREFMKWFLTV